MKKIHEGLGILLKYGNGDIAAEHDEIWAGHRNATPDKMEKADVKRLKALGWAYEDDMGWRHFT